MTLFMNNDIIKLAEVCFQVQQSQRELDIEIGLEQAPFVFCF
jgi:hypothetical protein